LGDTGKI
jgi:hypothetical protein